MEEFDAMRGGGERLYSRVVGGVLGFFRAWPEALRQAREAQRHVMTIDMNPRESDLRWSAAPAEYLPKPPDFVPLHDDTIVDTPE